MLQRSLRFAIFSVSLLLCWTALAPLSQTLLGSKSIDLLVASQSDPESLIAHGERLPLVCVDMFALELIPGVSDNLATELLSATPRIIQSARRGVPAGTALQIAKGVGALKSHSLLRFISLEDRCTLSSLRSKPADKALGSAM
jgi:hypothetical protein